jgi:putative flavoprotein involved in K+ transport
VNRVGGAERVETVIIGGGQAGLAVGFHLKRRSRPFVILDANERIGDSWRKRWDSLRLFTTARFSSLSGWRILADVWSFPSKDQMADYLEAYAARFDLPIRTGVRVDRVSKEGDGYVVSAGARRFDADNVVVACGAHQNPHVPAFAKQLDPSIVQLHSSNYRNPSQLQDGGVLVVGAGNSGADISLDVVGTHPTWISGPSTGHLPFRIETPIARVLLIRIMRFVGHHVLTLRTPIGRNFRTLVRSRGGPLIRVKPKDLSAAGIEWVSRTIGVEGGFPALEDGRVLHVSNVVWCTGFRQDLSWIDLPVFGDDGELTHDRGLVPSEPGLSFAGLVFQFAATSDVITGVSRDAEYIAKHIASRQRSGRPKAGALTGS